MKRRKVGITRQDVRKQLPTTYRLTAEVELYGSPVTSNVANHETVSRWASSTPGQVDVYFHFTHTARGRREAIEISRHEFVILVTEEIGKGH